MHFSTLLPLALAMSAAEAVYQGFNYGSTFTDNSAKQYQDFVNEFNTAKSLVGTSGFTSARLYTMIQAGTTNTVISAIQAAQDTQTSLLLGMWASAGDADFANEMQALKSAVSSFPNLASSIAGLSVGSEDLYRVSPIGIENMSGVGAGPDVVTNYINQVRSALKGTSWSSVPVGHVDTWTAWVNGSNSAVITNSDFLGVDAYPYFQNTMSNSIADAPGLFNQAISNTQGVSQGKPVWITETGWPVSGPVSNLANADTADAKTYWDTVGCPNFGKVNTWWYTLQDDAPTTPSPSFGLVGNPLTTTPFYDLSCANATNTTSSTSSSNSTSTASSGSVPVSVSGGLSPSGAAAAPQYANTTYTSTINGKPTTIVASTPVGATATGSSTKSSTGTSASVTSYTGAASAVKGSAVGILGAIAAAVMLL